MDYSPYLHQRVSLVVGVSSFLSIGTFGYRIYATMCLLETFTDLVMNDYNTLQDTAGYMASLQAHFTCELHLYCVLLHFSIMPLFVAVNYPSIVQPVCYVAVHSVFLCVRSTSQSTVLLSLLLCSSNATVWIIPTPCGKCFVLLWPSSNLSILYSEMSFSRLHNL